MPSTYSRAVKAEALALVEMGETAQRAAERLNIPERTVSSWALQMREIAPEQEYPKLMAEHYRLARRYMANQHDALDTIEEEGTASKNLHGLIMGGGVSTDKVLKDREPKYGMSLKATGPIVIVCNAQAPVIEGECTDVTEVQDERAGS